MPLESWDPLRKSPFLFHARAWSRLLVPGAFWRSRLPAVLSRLEAVGAERVLERVRYLNRVAGRFRLPASTRPLRLRQARGKHNYFLDLVEFLRFFDRRLAVAYRFGDKTAVPDVPTLVKARPIAGENANSVLFKLNTLRHFNFVRDRRPYAAKRARLVWRGKARRPNRVAFLERYLDHPLCDVGEVNRNHPESPWLKPYLRIAQQLENRFVLSLEGNDVASNLKWILSSNSLCFMPRPRFETWFLEGQLVPGRHYVCIADDASDLEEKLEHYTAATDEAEWILANAHAHVARFQDREEERLTCLLVLVKYFTDSGQLAPDGPLDRVGALVGAP